MKIKNLAIESYRHLQNVNFDFTYPNGHINEGKPLDKICFIGQSATGKTSILELIKNSLSNLREVEIVNGAFIFQHFQLSFSGKVEYLHKDSSFVMTESSVVRDGREYQNMPGSGGGTIGNVITENDRLKLLYLSADIISRESVNILNQNPLDILTGLSTNQNFSQLQKIIRTPNYIYEFGQDVNAEIWFSLLSKILDYRKRFTQMASELINKGAIADLTRLNKQYAKWSETNKNPLITFANYFNPVLDKLNLEIDLINTEYSIPIKSKSSDEIVPISSLSTGTKGLLLSMFPMYELDTSESMILLDEPERSLFPDMQIDLISNYRNLAPDAQFIVATHSPFIAAAFEPEERFILFFNKEGKVAVRKGESPIGDDPNDILTNDFNVDYYNDFGKKAYKEYLELKKRVSLETEPEKKKELIVELAELGDKYNF